MSETTTLADAIEEKGTFAVWELLSDEERKAAAAALWANAERETKDALTRDLATQMKFRPQAVRVMAPDKVAPRLAKIADTSPDLVRFQFLFHLHLAERRDLMAEYLDALELEHEDGVLQLDDDAEAPDEAKVTAEAEKLVEEHGHEAVVYLATLAVADAEFWSGVTPVLEKYDAEGEPIG